MSYRGRIAPSPTGLLHMGHARTFWAAHERARTNRGTLVLRNDDLDLTRVREEFVAAMYEDLRWLGIEWQEGPDLSSPGPHAPYSQSQRSELYLESWNALRAGGHIFPCTCSRKDLALAASAPHEALRQSPDDEPLYPGTCRSELGSATESFPAGVNWRFRVPQGEVVDFEDGRFGRQRFIAGVDFGDFLVWRRDHVPGYQLACVADDHAMQITEVVRGADLLRSTARQLLIYHALRWPPPQFFHCPLVTDSAGVRLAKRHDSLSVRALREQGYRPEQVRQAPSGSSLK